MFGMIISIRGAAEDDDALLAERRAADADCRVNVVVVVVRNVAYGK